VKTGDPVDGQASQEIRFLWLFRLAYCAPEELLGNQVDAVIRLNFREPSGILI